MFCLMIIIFSTYIFIPLILLNIIRHFFFFVLTSPAGMMQYPVGIIARGIRVVKPQSERGLDQTTHDIPCWYVTFTAQFRAKLSSCNKLRWCQHSVQLTLGSSKNLRFLLIKTEMCGSIKYVSYISCICNPLLEFI